MIVKAPPAPVTSIYKMAAAIFFIYMLAGCDVDSSNNIPPVPSSGLVMYAEANLHESEETAQIAAAVYRDGEPVGLVGGDVFEARTTTQRVLLKDRGSYAGSYSAPLVLDDVQDVFFNVVHEPVEARDDRWYPVDLLNIDPGPGELVGRSATVSFPPEVIITSPASGAIYNSPLDIIDLSWLAIGAGDTMRVLSFVSCSDGLRNSSYATAVDIVDDDGLEAIALNNFIFDVNEGSAEIRFISDAAQALLQELLDQLSDGNIDPDFVARKVDANPIVSNCEIRLFLQRQRKGVFDASFDDGLVIGSRSAEVTVHYGTAVPFNLN
jgi:hypothetical protein